MCDEDAPSRWALPVSRRGRRLKTCPGNLALTTLIAHPVRRRPLLFVRSHRPSIALVHPDDRTVAGLPRQTWTKVRALRCEKLFVVARRAARRFRRGASAGCDHHLERLEETCGIVRDRLGLAGEEVIPPSGWNVPYPTWGGDILRAALVHRHRGRRHPQPPPWIGSGAIRREGRIGINRYFLRRRIRARDAFRLKCVGKAFRTRRGAMVE